jgi:hypothetical protein
LHLFVVVTEEDDMGMHVLVGVSSIDPDLPHDATCELNVGEHDFIKHPSFAAYEFAIHRHKNHVDDKTKKKVYKQHKDASAALVAKIAGGIKKSPFSRRAIKDGYGGCLRATAKRQKAKT